MRVWLFKALFSFTAQSVKPLCAYLKSDLKSGAYKNDFWHQKYFGDQSSGVHKCDVETFFAQTQKLNFTAKLEDDSTTEWKKEEEEHQSEGMQPSALRVARLKILNLSLDGAETTLGDANYSAMQENLC